MDKRIARHSMLDKQLFIMQGIIFVLVIGLRNCSIGIDTFGYYLSYEKSASANFSALIDNFELSNSEIGFNFLNTLFRKLSFSWTSFSILLAIIYICPIFELIYRRSQNLYFSVIIFLLGGFFFFPMSTIRQSVAIGLTVMAFNLYDKGSKYLCLLFLLLSVTVHNSAFIAIIPYILSFLPLTKKTYWWWLIAALVTVVFFRPILQGAFMSVLVASGREYDEIKTGGNLQELFFVITYLLPYFLSFDLNTFLKKNKFFMISLLTSIVLLPILNINPTFSRLYFYFSIYLVVLIPSIFAELQIGNAIRNIGELLYMSSYIFLLSYYFNPDVQLVPYLFFWETC